MSFYNEELDVVFKIGFSSSYVKFSDADIEKRALDILLAAIHEPSSTDKFLMRRLVNEGFKTAGRAVHYEPVYAQYLKSLKLFLLFEASVNFDYLKSREIKDAAFALSEKTFFKKEAERYARYEKIPTEFALVGLNDNCIKYLVGLFLKKHLSSTFTQNILRECHELTKKWHLNLGLATPYERTGEFQSYIHGLANSWPGDRGELSISTKLMRVILSTARLHFSYVDEKNLSISGLNKVLEAQQAAADLELESGKNNFLQNACLASTTTKRYIKNWRKRHLGPFFRKPEAVENLRFALSLDGRAKYTKVQLLLLGSEIFSADELHEHFSGEAKV